MVARALFISACRSNQATIVPSQLFLETVSAPRGSVFALPYDVRPLALVPCPEQLMHVGRY